MDRLFAPWRSSYIGKKDKQSACPFCVAVEAADKAANFVLESRDGVVTLLNKYPYNSGHLLIVPALHVASLAQCSDEVLAGMMKAVCRWQHILQSALSCHGFNIGLNLGTASGGSIPEHLHMHIVPRWQGDTNFLATIGETKLISMGLEEVYTRLRESQLKERCREG